VLSIILIECVIDFSRLIEEEEESLQEEEIYLREELTDLKKLELSHNQRKSKLKH